jgi:hypothetical protein
MGAVVPFDPASIDYTSLPDIDSARLPQTYQAAKTALATCENIDECKSWSDKAAAMASYAKMAKDEELGKMCVRIRGRAIRRCGELTYAELTEKALKHFERRDGHDAHGKALIRFRDEKFGLTEDSAEVAG